MGAVWSARHLPSGQHMAVKVLHENLAHDPKWTARFLREVTMAVKLNDPHIVRTMDHGVMRDGRLFLVMELLQGHSLQHQIDGISELSLRDAKTVVAQIAHALTSYAR